MGRRADRLFFLIGLVLAVGVATLVTRTWAHVRNWGPAVAPAGWRLPPQERLAAQFVSGNFGSYWGHRGRNPFSEAPVGVEATEAVQLEPPGPPPLPVPMPPPATGALRFTLPGPQFQAPVADTEGKAEEKAPGPAPAGQTNAKE